MSQTPVIVAGVAVETGVVPIGNVAEVLPAETVTEVETVATEELDDRATVTPPVGASPLRFTVPVALTPPVTDAGDTARPTSWGAVIVSVVLADPPPPLEVTVAVVEADTGVVVQIPHEFRLRRRRIVW